MRAGNVRLFCFVAAAIVKVEINHSTSFCDEFRLVLFLCLLVGTRKAERIEELMAKRVLEALLCGFD